MQNKTKQNNKCRFSGWINEKQILLEDVELCELRKFNR